MTVTREPEWDDESREEMLALAEYESEICDCGFHKSLTRDQKNNNFSFVVDHCPVCAGRDQYARLQSKEDGDAEEKLKDALPATPHPGDGRRVFMRMDRASVAE